MKKILSFFITIMCLTSLLCNTCLATGGSQDKDPFADAKAKFASLSQKEKDALYEQAGEVVDELTKLLNDYAKCGVIDSKTYEIIITGLSDRVATVKANGEFPGFLPPPPPPPLPKN